VQQQEEEEEQQHQQKQWRHRRRQREAGLVSYVHCNTLSAAHTPSPPLGTPATCTRSRCLKEQPPLPPTCKASQN